MTTDPITTPQALGYWLRYGPTHTRLHVTRFELTGEGVTLTAACGAHLVAPSYEIDVKRLNLATTAVAALNLAQTSQLSHLCPTCRAKFTKADQ